MNSKVAPLEIWNTRRSNFMSRFAVVILSNDAISEAKNFK